MSLFLTFFIRIDSVSHKIAGTADTPAYYTIRQHCEYTLKIAGTYSHLEKDSMDLQPVQMDKQILLNNL